jgi:hypothetical protein
MRPSKSVQRGALTTIGIGDLGNEIGMGSLPYELVARSIPRGDQIWCRAWAATIRSSAAYPIGRVPPLLGAVALLWPRAPGAMLGVAQGRSSAALRPR